MRDERTNDEQQLKIELLSQWKLEAESRNFLETLVGFLGVFEDIHDQHTLKY